MKNFKDYPPSARFIPGSDLNDMLSVGVRFSVLFIAVMVALAAIDFAQFFLAPVVLAVVIGLMFGPLADRIEKAGIPAYLSAGVVIVFLLTLILAAIVGVAVPLSTWTNRLPAIWSRLQLELADWKAMFHSLNSLQEQFQNALGAKSKVPVSVDEGSTVRDVAFLAPAVIAQIVMFLGSFYFFVAARNQVRIAILSLCYNRRLRWRVAHIFRDVEILISKYLLTITVINAALGLAVGLTMWLIDIPSPLLWGVMAAVLNFVVYVGPAVMIIILLGVGLATGVGTFEILSPALVFFGLNFIESQFVTPHALGRAMTLNPFIVFLSITFWIWMWGPIGGFVAVPFLLVLAVAIRNIFPAPHKLTNSRSVADAAPNEPAGAK